MELLQLLSQDDLINMMEAFGQDGLNIDEFVLLFSRYVDAAGNAMTRGGNDLRRRWSPDALQNLFKEVDYDGDESVTWDEFTSFAISTALANDENNSNISAGSDPFFKEYILQQRQESEPPFQNQSHQLKNLIYLPGVERLLACGFTRNTLHDCLSPACLEELKVGGRVLHAAYVQPMSMYCVTTNQNYLQFFDQTTTSGIVLRRKLTSQQALTYLHVPAGNHASSPKLLAGDREGGLHLCNLENLRITAPTSSSIVTLYPDQVLTPFPLHQDTITCIDYALGTKHNLLFTSSLDNTIKAHDYETFQHIIDYPHLDKKYVKGISVSAYHHLCVSCGSSSTACAFSLDLQTNAPFELIDHINPHIHPLVQAKCIPNSHQIITADSSGMFKVWDIRQYKCVYSWHTPKIENLTMEMQRNSISNFAYIESQKKIITVGRGTFTYQYDARQVELTVHADPIVSIVYNPITQTILTCTAKEVRIWNISSGSPVALFRKNLLPGSISDSEEITYMSLDHIHGRRFFLGTSKGRISAHLSITGRQIWDHEVDPKCKISFVEMVNKKTFIMGSSFGELYMWTDGSVSPQSVLFTLPLSPHNNFGPRAYSTTNQLLLFTSLRTNGIYVLDAVGRNVCHCNQGAYGPQSDVTAVSFLYEEPDLNIHLPPLSMLGARMKTIVEGHNSLEKMDVLQLMTFATSDHHGSIYLWMTCPRRVNDESTQCIFTFHLPKKLHVIALTSQLSRYLIASTSDHGMFYVWDTKSVHEIIRRKKLLLEAFERVRIRRKQLEEAKEQKLLLLQQQTATTEQLGEHLISHASHFSSKGGQLLKSPQEDKLLLKRGSQMSLLSEDSTYSLGDSEVLPTPVSKPGTAQPSQLLQEERSRQGSCFSDSSEGSNTFPSSSPRLRRKSESSSKKSKKESRESKRELRQAKHEIVDHFIFLDELSEAKVLRVRFPAAEGQEYISFLCPVAHTSAFVGATPEVDPQAKVYTVDGYCIGGLCQGRKLELDDANPFQPEQGGPQSRSRKKSIITTGHNALMSYNFGLAAKYTTPTSTASNTPPMTVVVGFDPKSKVVTTEQSPTAVVHEKKPVYSSPLRKTSLAFSPNDDDPEAGEGEYSDDEGIDLSRLKKQEHAHDDKAKIKRKWRRHQMKHFGENEIIIIPEMEHQTPALVQELFVEEMSKKKKGMLPLLGKQAAVTGKAFNSTWRRRSSASMYNIKQQGQTSAPIEGEGIGLQPGTGQVLQLNSPRNRRWVQLKYGMLTGGGGTKAQGGGHQQMVGFEFGSTAGRKQEVDGSEKGSGKKVVGAAGGGGTDYEHWADSSSDYSSSEEEVDVVLEAIVKRQEKIRERLKNSQKEQQQNLLGRKQVEKNVEAYKNYSHQEPPKRKTEEMTRDISPIRGQEMKNAPLQSDAISTRRRRRNRERKRKRQLAEQRGEEKKEEEKRKSQIVKLAISTQSSKSHEIVKSPSAASAHSSEHNARPNIDGGSAESTSEPSVPSTPAVAKTSNNVVVQSPTSLPNQNEVPTVEALLQGRSKLFRIQQASHTVFGNPEAGNNKNYTNGGGFVFGDAVEGNYYNNMEMVEEQLLREQKQRQELHAKLKGEKLEYQHPVRDLTVTGKIPFDPKFIERHVLHLEPRSEALSESEGASSRSGKSPTTTQQQSPNTVTPLFLSPPTSSSLVRATMPVLPFTPNEAGAIISNNAQQREIELLKVPPSTFLPPRGFFDSQKTVFAMRHAQQTQDERQGEVSVRGAHETRKKLQLDEARAAAEERKARKRSLIAQANFVGLEHEEEGAGSPNNLPKRKSISPREYYAKQIAATARGSTDPTASGGSLSVTPQTAREVHVPLIYSSSTQPQNTGATTSYAWYGATTSYAMAPSNSNTISSQVYPQTARAGADIKTTVKGDPSLTEYGILLSPTPPQNQQQSPQQQPVSSTSLSSNLQLSSRPSPLRVSNLQQQQPLTSKTATTIPTIGVTPDAAQPQSKKQTTNSGSNNTTFRILGTDGKCLYVSGTIPLPMPSSIAKAIREGKVIKGEVVEEESFVEKKGTNVSSSSVLGRPTSRVVTSAMLPWENSDALNNTPPGVLMGKPVGRQSRQSSSVKVGNKK